jgi:phosphoglycolate phosphatase-like HAD superfamily hydrolase
MIETIHPGVSAPDARIAIFDFDGTVSLIRAGWFDIMLEMMTETLGSLKTGESEEEIRTLIKAFVWANTGRDTLYQMIALSEAVAARGGVAPDPQEYKQRFLVNLFEVSHRRIADLRAGRAAPDDYLVPGTRAMLEELRGRGMSLYLASGTDEPHLKEEADLLDVTRYFDGGVYGALPDPQAFNKRLLVERVLKLSGMRPDRLIGFGDGPVEIQELKRGKALAVGLATDEPECRVTNRFKRDNLVEAGADYIIPNYLCRTALLPALFASHVMES